MIPQYTPAAIDFANRRKAALARIAAAGIKEEAVPKRPVFRPLPAPIVTPPAPTSEQMLDHAIERAMEVPLPPVNRDILDVATRAPAPQRADIRRIIKAVASTTSVSVADMMSQKKHVEFVGPRMTAIFCAWALLPHWTLPKLGMAFNRDHTSILHAVRKVCKQRSIEYPHGRETAALIARQIVADGGYDCPANAGGHEYE